MAVGSGLVLATVGLSILAGITAGALGSWVWPLAVGLAAAGGAAATGGLAWLASRTLELRRDLPPERYRGPGVVLLFFLVIVSGTLLSLAPVAVEVAGGGDVVAPGNATTVALLAITPLVLAAVTVVFVVRPRALVGVRFGDGPATARNVALGVGLGVVAWIAASVVLVALGLAYKAATGQEAIDEQLVAGLASQLWAPLGIVLVGLMAPVAEELFFRGVVLNAWEREHGTTWAVVGSTVMFAAAHLGGGSWLALVPILLLGLVLAVLYVRTRSLPLVIGMHATFNCISLALLFLGVQ